MLGGRYRLVRLVATGGMGQVWAADDTVLHRRIAVKVLRDDLAGQPAFLDRFEHEARHAASVTHPNIATLHDYVRDDTRQPHAFLVMELVNGEPLSAMLRRTPVPPLSTTVRILAQSADALAAAHRSGVVHRDVKPANILLDEDRQVKLTDFGIAGPVDDASSATRAEVLGTPHYMSPEQARGEPLTPASDLYSLGVVAYEMLSGRRPFEGDGPAAVIDEHLSSLPPPLPERVPAHLRSLVLSALAKHAVDRPPDAATFARVLRSTTAPTTDQAERTAIMPVAPPSAPHQEQPRRRRIHGAVFWAIAATVAIAAVVLSLGVAGGGIEPQVPVATTAPAAPAPASTAVVASTSPPSTPGGNDKNRPDKGNGKPKAKGG